MLPSGHRGDLGPGQAEKQGRCVAVHCHPLACRGGLTLLGFQGSLEKNQSIFIGIGGQRLFTGQKGVLDQFVSPSDGLRLGEMVS